MKYLLIAIIFLTGCATMKRAALAGVGGVGQGMTNASRSNYQPISGNTQVTCQTRNLGFGNYQSTCN